MNLNLIKIFKEKPSCPNCHTVISWYETIMKIRLTKDNTSIIWPCKNCSVELIFQKKNILDFWNYLIPLSLFTIYILNLIISLFFNLISINTPFLEMLWALNSVVFLFPISIILAHNINYFKDVFHVFSKIEMKEYSIKPNEFNLYDIIRKSFDIFLTFIYMIFTSSTCVAINNRNHAIYYSIFIYIIFILISIIYKMKIQWRWPRIRLKDIIGSFITLIFGLILFISFAIYMSGVELKYTGKWYEQKISIYLKFIRDVFKSEFMDSSSVSMYIIPFAFILLIFFSSLGLTILYNKPNHDQE